MHFKANELNLPHISNIKLKYLEILVSKSLSEIMKEHLHYLGFDHWNLTISKAIIVACFFSLHALSKHHT